MDFVPKNKFHADLAEKCRKALEVNFGQIPMPKGQTKRKIANKRNPAIPIFF